MLRHDSNNQINLVEFGWLLHEVLSGKVIDICTCINDGLLFVNFDEVNSGYFVRFTSKYDSEFEWCVVTICWWSEISGSRYRPTSMAIAHSLDISDGCYRSVLFRNNSIKTVWKLMRTLMWILQRNINFWQRWSMLMGERPWSRILDVGGWVEVWNGKAAILTRDNGKRTLWTLPLKGQ